MQKVLPSHSVIVWLTVFCFFELPFSLLVAQDRVALEVRVVDSESGNPVAARLQFLESNKVKFKPKNSLVVDNQILIDETVLWSPKPGNYEFSLERGPEFASLLGNFVIELGAKDQKEIAIERKSNLRKSNWYSGDLRAELPVEQLRRWQVADDLDVVLGVNKSNESSKEPRSKSKGERRTSLARSGVDRYCRRKQLPGRWWKGRPTDSWLEADYFRGRKQAPDLDDVGGQETTRYLG